jgi:CHAT domain-containing protein
LIAPSIQIMDLMQHHQQEFTARPFASLLPHDVLVVGNPTMPSIALKIGEPLQQLVALPSSGAEASIIAASFNTEAILGEAILGDKATKEAILRRMPKARVIHLATHGLLDDIKQLGIPGAIALSPCEDDNGFLTAGEILELNLNTELVILSACLTGLGRITGDGVIGLSRCLMAAGVSRVIVSLWSVGDLSTAFLMIKFHENLKNISELKPGDVSSSLNQAQKWLLNLTSDDAERELRKLEPHIYHAFLGRSKRVAQAYINRCLHEIRERAPHPFSNPVYWSAFITIGI